MTVPETLSAKAQKGCHIRILLMHPANPSLPGLINEAIPEVDLKSVVFDIEMMFDYFSKIASGNETMQVRQIVRSCPHFQLTRTDHRVLYIQYLYSLKSGWSPMWQCRPASPLYELMKEEFDLLWQVNEGADP